MGFTLRFLLGLFLVLAICSSSNGASTRGHVKFQSQEPSTLKPIDINGDLVNISSSNEEEKEDTEGNKKPKTDEINKIVSENIPKEEEIEPGLVDHKPLSVTENNDLIKESVDKPKTGSEKQTDLDINIEKYVTPEFQNSVYKIATSPDIEKYEHSVNESPLKSSLSLDTTLNYDFDKKFQTIKNEIDKNLEYIEKIPKSTHQFEETTDRETTVPLDIIKYKNTSFSDKNGNKIHKEEQVESGKSLDYGSSYHHEVDDEQKHLLTSEVAFDNKPTINETEELKNKIFRPKSTGVDHEVLDEKLNQTERRTALLSNKIEHYNTNPKLKWSFQNTPTTVAYTTEPGQKEEIMFVPYTKESPINISKRGSTKYINTVTTPGPLEHKKNKMVDEAAVENQIYPVQVPAPNKISKEEAADSVTTTESTTVSSENNTQGKFGGALDTKSLTSTNESSITEGLIMLTEPTTSSIVTLQTTKLLDITSESSEKTDKQNSTFTTSSPVSMSMGDEANITSTTSMPEKEQEKESSSTVNIISVTPTSQYATTSGFIGNSSSGDKVDENTTTSDMSTVSETILSTIGNYVSEDQTTIDNVTSESPPTTSTDQETTTQPDSTTPTEFMNTETTSGLPETLITSSPIHTSTLTILPKEQNTSLNVNVDDDGAKSTTPLKIEDRTTNGRLIKNLSTIPEFTSTELPFETTTTANNFIKQFDETTQRTEHTVSSTERSKNPAVERKPYPTISVDNRVDETTGSSYTASEGQDEGISGGAIAAIVISCIGAVCFIILAILLLVMRKRHKRFNYGQRCTPVSLDSYSVDNVSTYNSVRRKGQMRASKRSYGNPAFEEASVTHLLNFPELMKFGGNSEGITSEYEDIPQISVQTNELPEGCETKNRYANVIPLPESRVFLSVIDDCPNSDYINANYVMGPKNTKGYYIACQAPLQNTVDDFWRMVWEQQSRVILMLTHLYENGAEKCFDYLPPSEVLDCHRLFGDFQITLKKREVKEKYVISNLQLKNMVSNTWREVTQMWYLGWPERGVPSEEHSLVAFLIEARSYIKPTATEIGKLKESTTATQQSEQSPVVIHCSPGTGRTGTVIACDIAIREFELTRQVDIPKTVYQIRRNRAGAVQTKEQYAFIYRVITWYANKLTGGILDFV